MSKAPHKASFAARTQRYLFVGVLTLIPIMVTWIVISFMLNLLSQLGIPVVKAMATAIRPLYPMAADWVLTSAFQSVIAVLLVVIIIYLIGWGASRVVGARVIRLFEQILNRIPFVQTIYGGTKRLLGALQQDPGGVQRVVLINFPSEQMKVVGFVTRTFVDDATGQELAAVYVPTTPNPTSGYLEIVPIEHVVSTDWTLDEATSFIISGGAVAPDTMPYSNLPQPGDKS